VGGDAVLMFDPLNIEDIGAKLLQVATQPSMRESLSRAALRRRFLFSPRRSALKTLAVYRQTLGGVPRAGRTFRRDGFSAPELSR
jgi:glycosyltransferase involved in cell wall biosynthesis